MFCPKERTALIVLLCLVLSLAEAHPTGAQVQSGRTRTTTEELSRQPVDPEIVRLADFYGSLTDTDFREWLKSRQPAPKVRTYAQTAWINAAIQRAQLKVVDQDDDQYHVFEQVRPVLRLFAREEIINFIIYEEDTPAIETHYRNTILISTGLLNAVRSRDELSGMIAHELAHEGSDDDYDQALEGNDLATMRRLEAECDAVAALALRAVGMDPGALGQMLSRIAGATPEIILRINDGTHDYPTITSRLKLNEVMTKDLLTQQAALKLH